MCDNSRRVINSVLATLSFVSAQDLPRVMTSVSSAKDVWPV
jgi:hypothetical protein